MDLLLELSRQDLPVSAASLCAGAPAVGARSTTATHREEWSAAQVSAAIHRDPTAATDATSRRNGSVPVGKSAQGPPIPQWLSAMSEETNRSIAYMARIIKGNAGAS